jgi:hypothetical protein
MIPSDDRFLYISSCAFTSDFFEKLQECQKLSKFEKEKAASISKGRSPLVGLRCSATLILGKAATLPYRCFADAGADARAIAFVLLPGGKVLSRNSSRTPVLAGSVSGHCRSAALRRS